MNNENSTPDQSDAGNDKTGGKKGISVPRVTKKTAAVGAAIGIGSAAIVAALLYTNRGKKD